jgi:nitrite reductase/ring-hydroxylating ferredoxin subunit
MQKVTIAMWSDVPDRTPVGAQVGNVDLVVIRFDDNHSVLYWRCLHRGALMSGGSVSGDNLICGLHGWDYLFETGISSYNNAEQLAKFSSWLEGDDLCVDQDKIETWEQANLQPYDRTAYQGAFQDPHGDPAEPHVSLIRRLANEGLEYLGHHGPVTSMGVSREQLPKWDDIQFVTAQLARKPQLDQVSVPPASSLAPMRTNR